MEYSLPVSMAGAIPDIHTWNGAVYPAYPTNNTSGIGLPAVEQWQEIHFERLSEENKHFQLTQEEKANQQQASLFNQFKQWQQIHDTVLSGDDGRPETDGNFGDTLSDNDGPPETDGNFGYTARSTTWYTSSVKKSIAKNMEMGPLFGIPDKPNKKIKCSNCKKLFKSVSGHKRFCKGEEVSIFGIEGVLQSDIGIVVTPFGKGVLSAIKSTLPEVTDVEIAIGDETGSLFIEDVD